MDRDYAVTFEVAGPVAMFSRPDTGSCPVSYPVPTYSAAKGMFEAVARLRSAYVRPTAVAICKPIRYERFVTNYGGPLRKNSQIKGNNNYQLPATVLVDVCYQILGVICGKKSTHGGTRQRKGKKRSGKKDHCKLLYEMITTRLRNGQTYYTPCLGWKEFVPTYFGPPRPETKPDESINLVIPSLLHSMWERHQLQPSFRQNWEIVKGRMSYETRRPGDA